MAVFKVTKENFYAEVKNSGKTVLLDFYADWCGPCRMVAPIVEEISEEYPEILVAKVNVDEYPELAMNYGIISIPTLIVLKGGNEVNKAVGAHSKSDILALVGIN